MHHDFLGTTLLTGLPPCWDLREGVPGGMGFDRSRISEQPPVPVSDALLPEFDHEMTMTRRTLERVPEAKFGWKPHEKSMSMEQMSME